MNKNIKNFIKKVFIISTLIVVIFNIWDNFLNANTKSDNENINISNSKVYKASNTSNLGPTWVAISTNLWTNFTQVKNLPATIYKEIFSVSDLIEGKNINSELIWKNMIIIKEYLNILKTDVKQLINNSYNKNDILNAYIEQLEFRYKNWIIYL